jgi:hypothetical protein
MRRTWIGWGAGLLVAGLATTYLVGCSNASPSSSSRPSSSSLSQGVNLLDSSDPAWGFNVAYLKGTRVVYVESRMGQPKPEVYQRSNPEQPANEMDLRFVDTNNHTFYAQRGGDSWIDPSWASDIKRSADPTTLQPSSDELEQNWAVAHEAGIEIAKVLPATFKDHAYHLGTFGGFLSPANNPTAVVKLGIARPSTTEVPYSTFSASSATSLDYNKYAMSLDVAGSHSAVATWIAPGEASWSVIINACNHGQCAYDSGVTCSSGSPVLSQSGPGGNGGTYTCPAGTSAGGSYNNWHDSCWGSAHYYSGGASVNGATDGNQTGANDGYGGCQTAYNWDSGSGSHLCNDDATYEMWQVNNGNQNSPTTFKYSTGACCEGDCCGSWCSMPSCPGSKGVTYACNCAGACSGDWATPNCF